MVILRKKKKKRKERKYWEVVFKKESTSMYHRTLLYSFENGLCQYKSMTQRYLSNSSLTNNCETVIDNSMCKKLCTHKQRHSETY